MVPYETANPKTAREEISKILRRFGCESVGFMDDYTNATVTLAFKHRGRAIQLHPSAKGWAALWLREHPWSGRSKKSPEDHKRAALEQGLRAVNAILRDWIKGQVTAVETGILEFDAVFMPYMLANDGRPLIEKLRATNLLPPPEEK